MWWRNRKESWPPRGTQQQPEGSSREMFLDLRCGSLQPAGIAPEYFSGHPSWLEGAHKDHVRRSRTR